MDQRTVAKQAVSGSPIKSLPPWENVRMQRSQIAALNSVATSTLEYGNAGRVPRRRNVLFYLGAAKR